MARRLELSMDLDREAIDIDRPRRLYMRLRWRAPEGEAAPARRRLNLGIALDRSASMQGAKIEAAKAALAALVRELALEDVLTVVTFDDRAEVVVPARAVTDRGPILEKIARLVSGSSTDLSAGWLEAIGQMRAHVGPDRSSRLLILSDGHTNAGITDGEKLAEMARRFRAEGIETSTLGFGDGFHEDLLQEIASGGDGRFHYVETADVAGRVFEVELGGLLALHCQNLTMKVEWADTVSAGDLVNDLPHRAWERGLEVRVGNTSRGDERALIVRFEIPVLTLLGVAPVAKVRVEYDLVEDLSHQVHEFEVVVTLVKNASDPRCQPRVEVREQVVGLYAARARREALKQADIGEFDAAREILSSFRKAQEAWAARSLTVSRELDRLAIDERMLLDRANYVASRKSISTISYNTSYSVHLPADLLPSQYRTSAPPVDPTAIVGGSSASRPAAARQPVSVASLVLGDRRHALVRSITTIGPDGGCDLCHGGGGGPGVQATIVRDAVSFWAVSWGAGGLEVRGETREAAELLDGDVLRVGGVAMRFSVETDARPPGPERPFTARASWIEPLRELLEGAVTSVTGAAGEADLERALLLLAQLAEAERVAWEPGAGVPAALAGAREVRLSGGAVVTLREPMEGPVDTPEKGLPSALPVRFVTDDDGGWRRAASDAAPASGRFALVVPVMAGSFRQGVFRFVWGAAPRADFPGAPGHRLACLESVLAVAARGLWTALRAGKAIGGLRPGLRAADDAGAALVGGSTLVPLLSPAVVLGRRRAGDLAASWARYDDTVAPAEALLLRRHSKRGHRRFDLSGRGSPGRGGAPAEPATLVDGSILTTGGTSWTYRAPGGPAEATGVMEAWRLLAALDPVRMGKLQARLADLAGALDELDAAPPGEARAGAIVRQLERAIPRVHAWVRLPDGRIVAGEEASTGEGLDPEALAQVVIRALGARGERPGWDPAPRPGLTLVAPLRLDAQFHGHLVLFTPRGDPVLEEFDASVVDLVGLFLALQQRTTA